MSKENEWPATSKRLLDIQEMWRLDAIKRRLKAAFRRKKRPARVRIEDPDVPRAERSKP